MAENVEEFVEVIASISMSKSICVPKQATKEETMALARRLMPTPNEIIGICKQGLAHYDIRINTDLDLNGWDVDELEYVTDYEQGEQCDNPSNQQE